MGTLSYEAEPMQYPGGRTALLPGRVILLSFIIMMSRKKKWM